jgi:hypothetical protein
MQVSVDTMEFNNAAQRYAIIESECEGRKGEILMLMFLIEGGPSGLPATMVRFSTLRDPTQIHLSYHSLHRLDQAPRTIP